MVSETNLSVNDLVLPYFSKEENDETVINNMPGLQSSTLMNL